MKQQLLVITCVGRDRPGLVDQLTRVVLESKGNLVDSRMTVLGGEFAIIIMVSGSWDRIAKLEGNLPSLEGQLGLTIISKRTERRDTHDKMLPYMVEVISMDHEGIVYNIAEFFSSRHINIEDLSTGSYSAAHTGTPMFSMNMIISIPADIQLGELREQFTEFCDALNLDAVMEPVKA